MAKKRRKQNRHRPHGNGQSATMKTAERPRSARQAGDGHVVEDPKPARAAARPQAAPHRTRSEKKELARQEREAARRRMARTRRTRQLVWIAGLAVVVGVGVFLLTGSDDGGTPTGRLPGELRAEAPWPANGERSRERADLLGLPAEGTTMHEHANVQVFVHGEKEPVPVNIGSDEEGFLSVHTHEESGTVHLESAVSRTFTVGELFGVWGVRLTPSCVGGYCNDDTNTLQVFVNGEEIEGDPRAIELDDQDVVVVTYGTAEELPDPIPSTFDFSSVPQ